MFVVVTYDVNEERLSAVEKVLSRYLKWVQNSVFEGNLRPSQIESLKNRLAQVIDPEYDSVRFHIFESEECVEKIIIGKRKEAPSIL